MDGYTCNIWFERDRKMISLDAPDGTNVFTLWDDDVDQAIIDGFLPTPRLRRPDDADWLPCAIEYAQSQGLIQ